MKQKLISRSFTFAIASTFLLFAFAGTVSASVTPTLSLSATGTSDQVQISVTGDPSSSVILYYTPSTSGLQVAAIGNTNLSGSFSATVSSATYGLTTGNSVYVSVGGINGPKSAVAAWPTVATTASSLLTLSQTGLALSVGQTSVITATNNTQNALYISNNSNFAVASAAINGNQITVLALGYGSTSITVCTVGNTTNCPNVNVTVQNGSTQALVLSQNNVSVSYGQNTSVTISGGNGSYIVSNNSSSGNISTSITGNTLLIGGNSAASGTYSVTVCSSDMSSCGVVNVTLGTTTSSTISFSQTAPSLSVGQSMTVTVSGNTTGTYYISSNSNPGVVQASISGNSLTLLGSASGTATINVCASSGGCSSMTVTVNNSNSSLVYLSQSTLSVGVGQTTSVTIAGGSTPYVLLTASNTIFQAGISGNALYITGISVGSAQITVCSAGSTGCTSLALNVTATPTTTTTTTTSNAPSVATSFLSLSNSQPVLNVGQSTSISVSGGSGSVYSVAYNSNSNIVQASMNGGLLSLRGLGNGAAVIVVCDNSFDCGALSVSVGTISNTTTSTNTTSTGLPSGCTSTSGYSSTTGLSCGLGNTSVSTVLPAGCVSSSGYSILTGASCDSGVPVTAPVTTTPITTTQSTKYQFTSFLGEGASGNEVLELQQRLTDLGYYQGPINGKFGPLTAAGVSALQRAHGISVRGYVGPSTRAVLNAY